MHSERKMLSSLLKQFLKLRGSVMKLTDAHRTENDVWDVGRTRSEKMYFRLFSIHEDLRLKVWVKNWASSLQHQERNKQF